MKHILSVTLLAGLALYAAPTTAGPIEVRTCNTSNVTLNSITNHGENDDLLENGPYSSSQCAGVYNEPNNIGSFYDGNPNIGQLWDNLLNGEGGLLAPDYFVDSNQFIDLGTPFVNGQPQDPGWIHLGSWDYHNSDGSFKGKAIKDENDVPTGDYESGYSSIFGPNGTLFVEDLLTISLSCSMGCTQGTWSLITSPNIVQIVQSALGRSTFDNLAIAIKGANDWAVYNFNFLNIFGVGEAGNDSFNFLTPYDFYGTFNTSDLRTPNGGNVPGLSHIAFFVRDPLDSTQIPAPATIAIMGLGLVVIRLFRRR